LEARERYDDAVEWAQMHPYVLNWRNPWNDEMGFYEEDPARHTLGFYEDLVQEAAEDLGISDSPLIPGGDSDGGGELLFDGGLSWEQVSHEYWSELKQFLRRHPPRYVDPGTPLRQGSVDYFPHRHFQESVRDSVDSFEEYGKVMDGVRFQEYGVGAVIDESEWREG